MNCEARKVMWGVSTCVLVAFLATPVDVQGPFNIKATRDYFEKLQDGPYTYLQTPRTGLGVGTVYSIVDKTTWFIKRPESCFTSAVLEKAAKGDKLTPAQFTSLSSKTGWEVALKVAAAGPVTEDVAAEFKRAGATSAIVSIPSLTRQMMTIEEFRNAMKSGMDLECRTDLEKKSPERWVILETLSASDYSIKFEGSSGTNVSLSVGILKILFPKFKFGNETEYKGELRFSGEPHIVAMKAIRVKDALKFSSSGTDAAVVSPSSYYTIVDAK